MREHMGGTWPGDGIGFPLRSSICATADPTLPALPVSGFFCRAVPTVPPSAARMVRWWVAIHKTG